jgi:hypothetical protein
MPAPSLAEVDHSSVTAVNLPDRPPETIGSVRHRDEMDMIWHQAVRPDFDLVSAAPFLHQIQVDLIVVVTKERPLSTASPLNDVMGETRCDDRCQSGHD